MFGSSLTYNPYKCELKMVAIHGNFAFSKLYTFQLLTSVKLYTGRDSSMIASMDRPKTTVYTKKCCKLTSYYILKILFMLVTVQINSSQLLLPDGSVYMHLISITNLADLVLNYHICFKHFQSTFFYILFLMGFQSSSHSIVT